MVVCRKRETSSILKLVKSVDPDAFITVGSVMGEMCIRDSLST